MLNIVFNPKKAERHPLEMLLIGFFYASLSILLGAWIFPEYSSLVMIFFTVISCMYVIQGAIKLEESKELDTRSEEWILQEHYKALSFLLFLFLGFVFAFSFWAFILPPERVTLLFGIQGAVVERIQALAFTGNSITQAPFFIIFSNNLKVMLISLIFAFFYGAGAIFVLAWNASVMGFVIGTLARDTLGAIALPIAFTKYFLHGVPEMLAYLTTALAGGIIYIAFLRGDLFRQGYAKRLIIDTVIMILISIVLLALSSLIEVYISSFI